MGAEPETSANDANSPDPAQAAAAPESEPGTEVLSPIDMDCYECRACGYSYEPVKGDSRVNIAPGTPFEELPLNWRCPVCSAPKRQFSNIGPVNAPSGFKENLGYGLGVNTLTPGQKNILIFGSLALGFLFFISLYGLR
jgi:rubredoxin